MNLIRILIGSLYIIIVKTVNQVIPSEQCQAGSYRDSTLTDCTRCEQNYISEQDGAGECSPCSPGTISNEQNTQCGNE